MWQRYNQTTHIFEKSIDNGTSWTPLPLSASIITEGTIPNVAYVNQANNFSVTQILSHVGPVIMFNDTSQSANNKKIRLINSGTYFYIQSANDAETSFPGHMRLSRTGNLDISGSYSCSGFMQPNGYIYPGRVDTPGAAQGSWYIASHGAYGIIIASGMLIQGNVWTQGGYIYPARIDSGGALQSSYYLASHDSYGLYSNTGMYFTGSILSGYNITAGNDVKVGNRYFEKSRADANGIWRDFVPTLTGGVGLPSYNACKICSIGGNTAVVQFHGVLTVPATGLVNFQFIWNGIPIYATASAASTPMVRHTGTGMCLTLYGYNCVYLYYDGVGNAWPGGTYNISFTHTFEYYGS